MALYGLFLNLICFAIHVSRSRVFKQVRPQYEHSSTEISHHFLFLNVMSPIHTTHTHNTHLTHTVPTHTQTPKWEPAPLPAVYQGSDGDPKIDLEGLKNYTYSLKSEADKKRGPTFQDQQKTYQEKDMHCSRWFYNIFCFIEYATCRFPSSLRPCMLILKRTRRRSAGG